MIFRRIAFYSIFLLFVAGCSYTRSHQLPTILTSSEQRWIIPKGTPFKAIQSAKDSVKEFISLDDDLVVLNKGNLQELVEAANAKTIKQSRISKKQIMWGGGITSLLGIIATVFWNRRRKFKLDGNIKAEA